MADTERLRQMIVNLHEDGSMTPVEVPDLNELLGERIEGLQPDARTFLKLHMFMRDQDVVGRMFRHHAIVEMLEDLAGEGTLNPDQAVDLYDIAHETHDAFREDTFREARQRGIPVLDPSGSSRVQ